MDRAGSWTALGLGLGLGSGSDSESDAVASSSAPDGNGAGEGSFSLGSCLGGGLSFLAGSDLSRGGVSCRWISRFSQTMRWGWEEMAAYLELSIIATFSQVRFSFKMTR